MVQFRQELREKQIIRAKVLAPEGDAVGLVDDQQGDAGPAEGVQERPLPQSLRGGVDETVVASGQLPQPLLLQLAEGGRMIIPVGPPDAQQLQLMRLQNGEPRILLREPCRFVPLISDMQD